MLNVERGYSGFMAWMGLAYLSSSKFSCSISLAEVAAADFSRVDSYAFVALYHTMLDTVSYLTRLTEGFWHRVNGGERYKYR